MMNETTRTFMHFCYRNSIRADTDGQNIYAFEQ